MCSKREKNFSEGCKKEKMPSGRRFPGGKSSNAAANSLSSLSSNAVANSTMQQQISSSGGTISITEDKKLTNQASSNSSISGSQTMMTPKHVPIPTIPVQDELSFEALSLLLSIIALSLQLLHLYRSIWWLPQSHNGYTMNFYLIDPYTLVLILVVISTRFIHALLQRLIYLTTSFSYLSMAHKTMRFALVSSILGVISWCLYYMSERHSSMKLFYLCYPSVSVYFLMFGINVRSLFHTSTAQSSGTRDDRKTKFLSVSDKPFHNCSSNAAVIRSQVSSLRQDFNSKLKQALFSSSSSAYFCGIAPVIFAAPNLHYNVPWILQHVALFWVARLNAHFTQLYPLRYCDALHKTALHLGRWFKVSSNNSSQTVSFWNDSVLWPNGSIVKHNDTLYCSQGLCTAAEPGNSNHYRFHVLFNNPTSFMGLLLGVQFALITVQFAMIMNIVEWYQVLSTSLMILTNLDTLFRLTRDYLVCWKVYRVERIIHEKSQAK